MSGNTPDATRSCLGCPSLLTRNPDIIRAFGKTTGVPMCGRFGHVLGRPNATPEQNNKTMELVARNCPSHGEPRPSQPQSVSLKVFFPDPDAIANPLSDLDPMKNVPSCQGCINYIPDEVLHNEHGWTAGACAAKGKLIFPTRKVEEARGCDYRHLGASRRSLDGLMMISALSDVTTQAINPVGDFMRSADSIVEPGDYPTDAPVTDENKAMGIRAWRKIVDPEGTGNEVYLPIFNPEFFDEDERKKIPETGSDEHPELYFDHNGSVYKIAVLWTELDETPMLWGPSGVGKTEIYRHLAWLMQLPFYRISINGTTELDDLAGKMRYSQAKGTYFQYGRITLGWEKPCVMCVDEPNTAQPEVWEFIRPMTDNSKQLVLDMNEGESHDRHEFCFLGMAGNPAWDAINIGANVIGDADSSRLMHIQFGLPSETIERTIIKNRVKTDGWIIDNARLNFIMEVAKLIRPHCAEGALSFSWGIRHQIKVARALAWFAPATAYRMAVADMLHPDQLAIVLDQVKAKMPSSNPTFPKVQRIEED